MGQNQPKFFLFHLHKLSGCLANLALTTTSAIFIVNSQQAHQITLFTMGHSVCAAMKKARVLRSISLDYLHFNSKINASSY